MKKYMTQKGLICTQFKFVFPNLAHFCGNDSKYHIIFPTRFFHFCADDSVDFDSLLKNFLLKSAGGKLSGFILGIAHRFLMA